MKTAETLKIKGLTEYSSQRSDQCEDTIENSSDAARENSSQRFNQVFDIVDKPHRKNCKLSQSHGNKNSRLNSQVETIAHSLVTAFTLKPQS